ncbi:hypothetical protein NDN08_002251 [Rhodosorus marinus]|uniref:Probable ATP-dependent transporter ycf16 n=1 Tax=Rhodosorus marinus TaxID=101924 RepID=A0AAV8UW28_9RHOD|nr:hypothetical protein NDN08_002251 [Rhodosorus marinus]
MGTIEDIESSRSSSLTTETEEIDEKDEIVRFDNVHKTYLIGASGIAVLRGIDLRVNRGEFVAIYGPSGSGKSTMLSVMGTIDRHSKGDVFLFGKKAGLNATDKILANLRLKDIGFVFQAFNLLPSLTAFENVELPMLLAGKPKKERIARVYKLLDRVGMLHRTKSFPAQLSGGEQQRVTIARALANRPKLLLMDEPSGDLDTKNTDLIMDFLLELHEKQKITMIMVTHDVGLRGYADRVINIRDGRVAGDMKIDQDQRMRMRKNLRQQVLRSRREETGWMSSTDSSESFGGVRTELRAPTDYGTVYATQESCS